MNTLEKQTIALIIMFPLCFAIGIISYQTGFQKGFENGVESVEQRTPSFETSFRGGYVNEITYETLYNFTYPFADLYPPEYHNDSFVIGINIFAYYEGPTGREKANFGVKFSMMNLYCTNISLDLVTVLSERYNPPEQPSVIVGFSFNLENLTAATAYAYGQMTIFIFGHGALNEVSTIFGSPYLKIIEWEGDG